MAIVVESVSAVATATSINLTITKPTGVTVGDLLVATLQGADSVLGSVVGDQWNTLSGWTQAVELAGGNSFSSIQYRVATAADVSASNYTFTANDSETLRGYILRCSGVNFDEAEVLGVAGSTTLSYTPPVDGSLAVLSAFGYSTSTTPGQTATSYNTNGVSYTERSQTFLGDGTPGAVQAAAYGIQTTAAEITSFGATYSFSPSSQENLIAVFLPPVDATGTNTLITTTSTAFTQAGTCDTVGTSSFEETDTESFTQSGSVTTLQQWTNETKPSTAWVNEQK